MKKKLFCLMMACLMLCLPLLTSCGNNGEATVVDESERPELTLTFHTITDDSTTEAGIARVQSEINAILYNRYKTRLELKCYSESEYMSKIEALYADIDAAEDPAASPQLDIFYLPTEEAYVSAAANGRLLALDSYLKVEFKEFNDYLNQNLLAGASIAIDDSGAALYGLPNNKLIADEGWYYVIDQTLADKYGFEEITGKNLESHIQKNTAPQFSAFAVYAAVIAEQEKEAGVIPIANPAPINGVDFYDDIQGFPIATNRTTEYGAYDGRGILQTYGENSVLRKHFELMASFRDAGYFVDRELTAEDRFFLDVRQGSAEEVQAWKDAGYTVLTYRLPTAQINLCREGFYAVSASCPEDNRSRAVEVLQALYTNPDVHNLFAYGVEGIHYEVVERDENEKPLLIKRIVTDAKDVYVMDVDKSGNSLIGLALEERGLGYAKQVQDINRFSRLSGFASFALILDEDDQEWYDEIAVVEAECIAAYEKLWRGTSDWKTICDELNRKLDAADLAGFIEEVCMETFSGAAKKARDTDKMNYPGTPVYFQSELDAAEGQISGGTEETPETNLPVEGEGVTPEVETPVEGDGDTPVENPAE